MKIHVNQDGYIDYFLFIGHSTVNFDNLLALYGRHEKSLNRLLSRIDDPKHKIQDLLRFTSIIVDIISVSCKKIRYYLFFTTDSLNSQCQSSKIFVIPTIKTYNLFWKLLKTCNKRYNLFSIIPKQFSIG